MLINKKYLEKYCPLPKNYNYDEIMLYVPIAEKIWLKEILGDAFYDELSYQVEKNEVSDENATLFTEGGLYQYLSYATCLEGLPFIFVNFSEVGITKGHSDNSDSITQKELTYIESHLRRQVEFLKDSFIQFLCEHQDSFPLWNPSCWCKCGDTCCSSGAKLSEPNPSWNLFTTNKPFTNLL